MIEEAKRYGLVPYGFVLGSHLAKRLGLSCRYFEMAFNKDYKLNATIIKVDGIIYVSIDNEVIKALDNNYIAVKIKQDEIKDYEFVYQLSKDCVIGFYK